jgi:tetratricopeptide (TPR) repeat protein
MVNRLSHILPAACGLAFLLTLTGCAANQANREAQRAISDYFVGDYRSAVRRLEPLSAKTDENFVLNNLRLGSSALADYDLDAAEGAFLRAYEVLNSVGVNDGGRTLGAVLVSENIRIWRGEPYERAMANFYLGLVYYIRHDYANARAAFENALFKLRDYGGDKPDPGQYREQESNFALASIMLGRCYQRLGREDDAARAFRRVAEMRQYLSPLADPLVHAESNVLLVVDFGYGPQKVTDFDGSIVGFAPTFDQQGPVPPPEVDVDGRAYRVDDVARPPVDLLVLAQDRRWQSLDTLRAAKSAIGTGLMAGGLVYGTRRDARPEIALAAILGGALLKATSQADTRQWEMVPRTTYLIPLKLPPGRHDISVTFPDVPGVRQAWRGLVAPPAGEEATYYFRMQRYGTAPRDWPPPAIARAQTDAGPHADGRP